MRAVAGSRPQDLGLCSVQLEPCIHLAASSTQLMIVFCSSSDAIHMWAETVTPDQQNQVGGVQHEKNWAENRPLRYTTHTISVGDDAEDPVRTYWRRPIKYV